MYAIKIVGEFRTGTTINNKDVAKEVALKFLKEKLKQIHFLEEKDIFSFKVKSVKVERLGRQIKMSAMLVTRLLQGVGLVCIVWFATEIITEIINGLK